MKLLLLAFTALAALAQPTISSITSDDYTHNGARIRWKTNVSSTLNRIQWGLTSGSYPNNWTFLQDYGSVDHAWFISGVAPSTPVYYKVCSTSGSETCSAEQTFTTSAAESGTVTPPTLPTAVADMTPPASYTTTFTVAADCSDLQTQLDAAAGGDGNNNYRVIIPSTTVCGGRYLLKPKSGPNSSGTGFLVLTTDGVYPPYGSAVDPTLIANMPRIITNFVGVDYVATTAPPACDDIGKTWIDSDSTDSNAFLFYCTNTTGPVWTPVSMTSGTSVPASCTAETFFYKSNAADPRDRIWYCYETNRYLNWFVDADNNGFKYAALQLQPNAKRWIVSGIILQRPKLPSAYTSLLPTASGQSDQMMSVARCLAYTEATNDRISFDRVYFDSIGYPYRMADSFCFFRGTNIQLTGSWFHQNNRWRAAGAGESTPNTIFMNAAGGPCRIENNTFYNSHGITIFMSDDVADGMMTDCTVRRNTFFEDPADNGLGVASNGRGYYRRHMLELKRGLRWLIEGNTFNGGWPAGNQGATVAFSPRSVAATETVYVWDILFRYNKLLNPVQGFILAGHNDYPYYQTYGAQRIEISHNVIYNSGRASDGSTRGWPNNSQFNGQVIDMGLGISNLKIANNAFVGIKNVEGCCYANMISHVGDYCPYPNTRFSLMNNIYTSAEATTAGWWGVQACGTNYSGSAALDQVWFSGSTKTWEAKGNAWQSMLNGSFSDGATYPANNYRNETVTNFTGDLYRCVACGDEGAWRPKGKFLAGSSTARGFDGNDAGPDFNAFDIAQGYLSNQRVLSITSSGATVYWQAPDNSNACTIEYGTSATPNTGTRVTDTPTSRFRSKALTGLTTGTLYYYRIFCSARNMVSGSFTTL